MKQSLFLVLLALMATFFFACDKTTIDPDDSETFSGSAFMTTYRLPLVPGNEMNGEVEIVDNTLIEKENVSIVKPVLNQILEDLRSGKLRSYPTDNITTEIAPEEYFNHCWSSMEDDKVKMSYQHLNQCVEVIMDGVAGEKKSELTPAWLRLVWVDVNKVFPDKNFVQLKIEDLKNYTVDSESRTRPLATYLAQRSYEYYPINVIANGKQRGIRTHLDAKVIDDLIDAGELEQALNFYPN